MYDASIAATPVPAVALHSSAALPVIPQAQVGDLVIAPASIVHDAIRIDVDTVSIPVLSVASISVAGRDLEETLFEVETDRLFEGVLVDTNFTAGSITDRAFAAPMPVRMGGTGYALSASNDGSLAVGAGSNAFLFPAGLRWSDPSGSITIRGDLRIAPSPSDPDNYFALSVVGDRLLLSDALGTMSIDMTAPDLGVTPAVTLSEVEPANASDPVTVTWSVVDDDNAPSWTATPAAALYLAWYAASDLAVPRLVDDIAAGLDALGSVRIDLMSGDTSYTIPGLDPLVAHLVRGGVVDTRGNASLPVFVMVRPTRGISGDWNVASAGPTYLPRVHVTELRPFAELLCLEK